MVELEVWGGCGIGGSWKLEGVSSCQKGRVPHQPPEAAWGQVGLFADVAAGAYFYMGAARRRISGSVFGLF